MTETQWVLVPVNPTPEMQGLGRAVILDEYADVPSARNVYRAMLSASPKPPQQEEGNASDLADYDAGLLNDYGGGNVDWWQDYLRAEIGRANDFWRAQAESTFLSQAAQIEALRKERDELQDRVYELQQQPWPEWAEKVLKAIRKRSGYDGYDDADGVDLPEELEEAFSELEQEAERHTHEVQASREFEQNKNAAEHYRGKVTELCAQITAAETKLAEAIKERDDARHEVWNLGLCVGQIAKWPRTYFNRFYVEEWAIRTARILKRWGDDKGAREVLSVTSDHTKPNKRMKAAIVEFLDANGGGHEAE